MIKKILIPIFAFFTSNFVFAQIDSPTNLQVQTINSEYLLLNWDTINSENLKYYIIYQNTSPNAVTEVYTTELGNNDVDYSFLNPIENTTYYLRIRAIDLNDNLSDFSEEVAITWLETPNIISSSIINDSLEVSISAISTAGSFKFYRLYYKNDIISDFILQDSSEFANNLDVILKIPIPENNGFSYKYYISSVDTLNNEYVSEIDTFIIPDNIAPEIPVNLTGENLDKSIKLSWDEILNSYNDFLSYYIYQGTAPNPTTLVDSTTYYFTNQNEFIINGLTNGQIYYLRITAKDKNGNESAYSNEISITPTDITPPEIPQDLSISIGNQQISLSWSPVPNTDADLNGYWVYQGSESGNLATITSTTLTNITVPSLTNNSQYFFAVSSYDLSTNQSALSSELSGIPTELESETNNNFSTANVIDQKIRANLSTNDIDIFKFTGITSSEYDIYTTMPVNKLNGVNDTKIYLFDADTTVLLAQDDNSGTENYSKIRYTVPYDTTYYIKTIGATSNIIGDYQLIIFERKRDKFEINNNFSSASSLSNNSKIDSLSIYPMSDVDIFSFTANECDQLNLYFNSENFNGKIKLYNNNQELLETIDNTDFGDYINHIATYSGIYYASYESSDINNTSTGDYTLNFSIEKPASITNSILINEIQANIFTTNYADSLQFIELYNKGSVFVDLGGLKFSDGINFQFPEYSVLSPKSYFVIAKNQSAFTNFYGFEADYIWTSGTLSNISDTLLFVNQSDSIIDYVIYTNNTPFPQTENSENSSLELTNSEISNMSGTNWHASYLTNGTPKARNSVLSVYTDDIYENNNEITDAKRLMAGKYSLTMSAIDESNNADTVDWFYYKAEAQEKLEINAETNTESFFYYLYVYDSAGALLTANEDSASAKSVDYIFTQNQDIFIKIRAIDNEANYSLEILSNYIPKTTGWKEEFEVLEDNFLPFHWQFLDSDDNNSEWKSMNTIGINETGGIQIAPNSQGNNDWLFTPFLRITQSNEFMFYTKTTAGFTEKFEVYIADSSSVDQTNYILLKTDSVSSNEFTPFYYDLSAYEGDTIRIAIRNISINQNIQTIDNVELRNYIPKTEFTGIIKDKTTNMALEGVKVQAINQIVYSDEYGRYTFNILDIGNTAVIYEKDNYQTAKFNVELLGGNDTLDLLLKPITNSVVYYTGLENAEDKGYTDANYPTGWRVNSNFVNGYTTILPFAGDSMLILGGENSYDNNLANIWTNLPNSSMDLSKAQTAFLTFNINYNTEADADKIFPLAKNSNHSYTYLDINNDGYANSDDYFSGNSNGWISDTIYLDKYIGSENGNNVQIAFYFSADANFNITNFGVAIDELNLYAKIETEIPIPENFKATSYINSEIPMTWNAVLNSDYYKIFRSQSQNNYQYIDTTSNLTYTDTIVADSVKFFYKISAVTDFGESEFSPAINAISGTPITRIIQFDKTNNLVLTYDFEQTDLNTMSPEWMLYFDNHNYYNWQVGNFENAIASSIIIPEHTNFLYLYNDEANISKDQSGDATLLSPWFDLDKTTNDVFLSFDSYSQKDENIKHYIQLRDFASMNWVIIDSIETSNTWESNKIKLTDYIDSTLIDKRYQIGFKIQNSNTIKGTYDYGWAIDNFLVQEIPYGYFEGYVYSKSGNPIYNAEISIAELNLKFYTDTTGFFESKNTLYHNNTFNTEIQAYTYTIDNISANNISITAFDTLRINVYLEHDLPAPNSLKLAHTVDNNVHLSWHVPVSVGVIESNIEAFYDYYKILNPQAIKYTYEEQLPIRIRNIVLNAAPAQLMGLTGFKIVGTDESGMPDLANIYYESPVQYFGEFQLGTNSALYPELQSSWYVTEVDAIMDTPTFFIVFDDASRTIDFAVDNATNAGKVFQYTSGQWETSNFAFKTGVRYDIGVNFTGLYDIYKSTNNQNFEKIESFYNSTQYIDSNTILSIPASYKIKAMYDAGYSDFSEQVEYDLTEFPWINDSLPHIISKIENDINVFNDTLNIHNIGQHQFDYSVEYFPGFIPNKTDQATNPNLQDNIHWAKISTFSEAPQLGETAWLDLFIENNNQDIDADWIQKIIIHFPSGIIVDSSSNFVQLGYEQYLYTNQAIGNGITVQWSDPDISGRGEILSNQIALSQVKITNQLGDLNELYILYEIYGDNNKIVADSFPLFEIPFIIDLQAENTFVNQQDSDFIQYTININSHRSGYYPGYLQINSNAVNEAQTFVPFDISIERGKYSLNGVITNIQLPELKIANEKLRLTDTLNSSFYLELNSDNSGYFNFESVPQGDYFLKMKNPDYETYNKVININQNLVQNISVKPLLVKSDSISTTDSIYKVKLDWNKLSLFDRMEGFENDNVRNTWESYDIDNDGKTYIYSSNKFEGESSASVKYNKDGNDDWLISLALQTTDLSVLSLATKIINTGILSSAELNIKISTVDNSLSNFTTTLLNHQFTESDNWENLNISLQDYASFDTIWIAFQYISIGTNNLFIDDIKISELKEIPEKFSSIKFLDYKIFRSSDNNSFIEIGENTSNTFYDLNIEPETKYYYKTRVNYDYGLSEYSQIDSIIVKNDIPTIASIADIQIDEDTPIKIPLTLTDLNKTNLLLSGISSESNLDLNFSNSELEITPAANWNGISDIEIIVSDNISSDTAKFVLTVNPINDLPTLATDPENTVNTGEIYSYALPEKDADEDIISYTFSALPNWLKYNDTDKILEGIPKITDIGDTILAFSASDNIASDVNFSFNISVIYKNIKPEFTSQAILTINEAEQYSYKIEAFDEDDDILSFEVLQLPIWMEYIESDTTISGIPQNENIGNNSVAISVSDGINAPVIQNFNLNVIDINQAPIFLSQPYKIAIPQTQYTYNIDFYDPDNDEVQLQVFNLPYWITFVQSENKLTGVPAETDIGNCQISIIISDGMAENVTQEYTLSVQEENYIPVVISDPITEAKLKNPYYYIIVVDDDRPDSLEFTPVVLPSWMSINHKKGDNFAVLQGIPQTLDADTLVNIAISDKVNAPINHKFPVIFSKIEESVNPFPNPTTGYFVLDLTNIFTDNYNIRVYDMSDNLVFSENDLSQTQIELNFTHFKAGVYFISIYDENNRIKRKIIITK